MNNWLEAHIYVGYLVLWLAIILPCLVAEWQIRKKKRRYGKHWFLY